MNQTMNQQKANESTLYRWVLDRITLKEPVDEREEAANAWTHAIGIVLAFIAAVLVAQRIASDAIDGGLGVAALVFTFTMIVLYTSSTCYHLLNGPFSKRIARVMDHASIYFLIAGTYTPVMVAIGTPSAYLVLVIAWALTGIGIAFTLGFWDRYGVLHVIFYLAMGWMVVVIWPDVRGTVPTSFVYWAIAGGLSYTVGTIFYGLQNMPYNHAVWHLFVLGGSTFLFLGIYLDLLI